MNQPIIPFRRLRHASAWIACIAATSLLSACFPPSSPKDTNQLSMVDDTYAGVDTIVRQVVATMPKLCPSRGTAALTSQLGHSPFVSNVMQANPNHEVHQGPVYAAPDSRLYGVKCEKLGPVLVATVADTNNFNATSPFGRIVSEQIESRLAQQGFEVVEAHMANSMVMNQTGQFLLSRDLRALAQRQNASAVLVGTYLDADTQALVSLKLVRVSDDVIIAGSDYATPLPPDIRAQLIPSPAEASQAHYRPLLLQ